MKQKALQGYRPNYPKKLIKSAILTTAAVVAISGTAGCELRTQGEPMPEPVPTDELVLEGEVAIDEPTEQPLVTEGEVAIDETEDPDLLLGGEPLPEPTPDAPDPQSEGSGRFGPALTGKILVPEDPENP